jgi:hypothetical protein
MKYIPAYYVGGPKNGKRVNRLDMRYEQITVSENVTPPAKFDLRTMPSIQKIQSYVCCYEKVLWGYVDESKCYVFFVAKGMDKAECKKLLIEKGWESK